MFIRVRRRCASRSSLDLDSSEAATEGFGFLLLAAASLNLSRFLPKKDLGLELGEAFSSTLIYIVLIEMAGPEDFPGAFALLNIPGSLTKPNCAVRNVVVFE